MALTLPRSEPPCRTLALVESRQSCTACPKYKTCRAPCAELEAELPQVDELHYQERATSPERAEWLGTVRAPVEETTEDIEDTAFYRAEWLALLGGERARLEEVLRWELTEEQAELVRLLLRGKRNHEVAREWGTARPTIAIMRRRALRRLSVAVKQRSFLF